MIQAIWIITDTGQCIFSHKYAILDIDDQLISGLLVAFDAFSTESGIGGIQQIAGEDNQFVYGSSGKLLVAAIADKRDNGDLVEKLMQKIANIFQEKYTSYLHDLSFVDLNVFNGFEDEIDDVLLRKIYNRGTSSTIFATIVSIALAAGVFFLLNEIIVRAAFLVFLAFIPALFIGALIAGKSTYGLISSGITILPVIGYIAYSIITNGQDAGQTYNEIINSVFLMAVTYITIALLCGILGGGIIDRRRLFPLEKTATKIAVFPAGTFVSQPDLDQEQTYQQEVISAAEETFQISDYYTEEPQEPQESQENQYEWDQQ
ncbi:MAG: hypothetical protein FK730_12200 [Asgard group archaeon]|nr:hypothetical protein [Asgard group archaeon]